MKENQLIFRLTTNYFTLSALYLSLLKLYWSSILANHLTDGEPIPEELDTARLL